MQTIESFYERAGLQAPYPYQRQLAEAPWPDCLEIPTGMGKTAAVVLAWLYKRRVLQDSVTPRRLFYCLPMRVLVEQTERNVRAWLVGLGLLGDPGAGKVVVHTLMGGSAGAEDAHWAEFPEDDAILIGTQDMLLSRALMRGYGMSRYQWPIHFALTNNDALWVYDEVQLFGAGLPTTTQLDAFRREFKSSLPTRSLWMSATLNPQWMQSVDFERYWAKRTVLSLSEAEAALPVVRRRTEAVKQLVRVDFTLEGVTKGEIASYIGALASAVLDAHDDGANTLVILNNVERAQRLKEALDKALTYPVLLVHARYRAHERRELNAALSSAQGRVIVATQAIEAGVDLTSRVMFTELAPWAAVAQRFGRCNRGGEYEHATIYWIDVADNEKAAAPYALEGLAETRTRLDALSGESVAPANLPPVDELRPITQVLRRRDLVELFDIDPDLSGFDIDISPFIRDEGDPATQVFWRDFDDPNQPERQRRPIRDELCPASLTQTRSHVGKDTKAWTWDAVDGRWSPCLTNDIRPGMTLLLRADQGGYSTSLGFVAGRKGVVSVLDADVDASDVDIDYTADPDSEIDRFVSLATHLDDTAEQADALASLVPQAHREAVVTAALWHDIGKAHNVFQATMHACPGAPEGLLAKSACHGSRHARRHFRHELASLVGWLSNGPPSSQHDLIAYLIAAHHGKVRMGIRALPTEKEAPGGNRFARGIWEGDQLPAIAFGDVRLPETTLTLELMELGESERFGLSWTARTHALLREFGPFQLAWLETLVRIADWRASRKAREI